MVLVLKIVGALVGALVIVATLLIVSMCVINSPEYTRRVLLYGDSDTNDYTIFPERSVANAAPVSALPKAEQPLPADVTFAYQGAARTANLEELLRENGSTAFIVIRNDTVVYENYFNGSSRDAIDTSFSTAKSFDSTLIGIAIQEGLIGSVEDPVVKYIPEIRGRGLDTLTIRNLLRMDGGIRYLHNEEIPFYKQPFGDDAFTYYSPDLRKIALGVKANGDPLGTYFRYNNYHPLLEGLILERVTGQSVAHYLQEKLWKPLGMEYPASWSLDSEASGFEKMESGINARAIDYARFGLLFLHNGQWNGHQIISAQWVQEATAPDPTDTRPFQVMKSWPSLGGYYGYHWWGLKNADGSYDYAAQGKLGQTIYVAPRQNMVIVRFGSDNASSPSWALVAQALVSAMP